ncbi:MAG: Do family serine endopeptidase [Alphaproteobacteria bacterium]|nr:Do family serine endopeptidase [Alphaproteobacteria bacterium]
MTRVAAVLSLIAALAALAVDDAKAQQRAAPQSRQELQLSFAPVVKRAMPAVVNIYTGRNVAPRLLADPMFRQFFGDQIPGRRVQNSLGSGVIVDPAGLIVTNHHVIRGADEIKVVLADRREFEATVLRADERTDLAVLKISAGAETLPALELRDSDDLEVGDIVLALGNPFGVGQTVTMGIVSALARTKIGIADYRFFIQTDAAINPGNSGGALVTVDGRLVGINTAIYNRDGGGSIGIGFAVPSNMVRAVVAGAASGQRLVRPWFGANGQTVTAEIAASIGLSRPTGVLIRDVDPGSPAEKAGLRRGDVLVSIDGREVQDVEALRFRIATNAPGQGVAVGVIREGRERAATAALVVPPETPPRDLTPLRGNQPLSGATIANLSPALVEELEIDLPPRGVIVTEVRRGTPAARLGLLPGDQLLRIGDRELRTTEDVRRAVSAPLPWRIQLRRGDNVLTVTVGG